jgi:hypothetical protein
MAGKQALVQEFRLGTLAHAGCAQQDYSPG